MLYSPKKWLVTGFKHKREADMSLDSMYFFRAAFNRHLLNIVIFACSMTTISNICPHLLFSLFPWLLMFLIQQVT
uniref:Uncharacterized protein n=1 Tax=Arundo donax TaxID=35708 RepID=A0A0A8Y3J0_ARUDO